jgi:hypothetical protein
MGEEHGFASFDEVNDILPLGTGRWVEIDGLVSAFERQNFSVYEETPVAQAVRGLVADTEGMESKTREDPALSIRNVHFDLADLPLSLFRLTNDRELSVQLVSGPELLRAGLDVKLHELRKVKALSYQAYGREGSVYGSTSDNTRSQSQ